YSVNLVQTKKAPFRRRGSARRRGGCTLATHVLPSKAPLFRERTCRPQAAGGVFAMTRVYGGGRV
ncbi:MAG: hypothetical protein LBM98_05845, partial [Oscillospiraceae bacterium]|nr:hypothetical protein [Oscillospiraceae bacterium]